jgi:excisionase family DNA binding protein
MTRTQPAARPLVSRHLTASADGLATQQSLDLVSESAVEGLARRGATDATFGVLAGKGRRASVRHGKAGSEASLSADCGSEASAADAAEMASPQPASIPLAQRMALSVEEAGALLGISRDLAYDLVASRQLPSVRLGRRLVVPRRALEEALERLLEAG